MTTRRRRTRKPAPTRKQKEAMVGVPRQNALAFVNDRSKPLNARLRLAIKMMKGSARADGRAALEAMLEEKQLTSDQQARIFSAIESVEARMSRKDREAQAQPEHHDLSGPATMAILADEDLYRRWQEVHREDDDQKWIRRLGEVPSELLAQIPSGVRDGLRKLPYSERLAKLDRLLFRVLR